MTLRVHVNLPALERRSRARSWRDAGLPHARRLRAVVGTAVRTTLDRQHVAHGEVSVTLLDDDAIRALNRDYLERDRATDVIAFSLGEDQDDAPLGDVYIGVERAMEQAADSGVEPMEEIVRLSVHGTLHVLGHDHAEGAARASGEMWRLQEELVRRVLRELNV